MIPVALIAIFGTLIRSIPQLDNIFTPMGTMLHEVDPYFNFRLLENMVANFPSAMAIDGYANYQGMAVGFPPLMNWIATIIIKLTGADPMMVAVWMPPVLGGLIAIPIYLIGKELFSKPVGLIGAFIAMILPCELFHRSLLGFYDHHILEATFFFWAMFLILRYVKTNKAVWAFLAGTALGLYLITWLGGMFGVTVLAIGCALHILWKPSKDTAIGFTVIFAITALFGLIYWGQPYAPGNYIPVMPLIVLSPGLAYAFYKAWDWALSRWPIDKYVVVGSSLVFIIIIGLIGYQFYGEEIKFALASVFWGFGSIISEAQPSYPYVWVAVYGVCAILMFGGMYYALKKEYFSPIFLVAMIIFFIAEIGQRRWSYYFGIDVALLSGLLVYQLSKLAIPKMAVPVTIVSLFFIFMPMVQTVIGVATLPTYNNPYYDSLVWLRENTYEPFTDDYYLDLDTHGEQPAYTVLAWWDYGHWINQISHRVPLANPANQMSFEMRAFWMSQNEEQAEKYISGSNIGIIVATKEMTDPSKFYAVILQLGEDIDQLEELRPNSMAVRMWTGEGITQYQLIYQNDLVKIWLRRF